VDEALAYSMYVLSCSRGGAYGCFNKGSFTEVGKGGAQKDPTAAAVLYAKICDVGLNFGCGALGRLYYRGRGVPQDREKGLRMLKESCDSGADWSCNVLNKLRAEEAAAGFGGDEKGGKTQPNLRSQ
jgi:TPR repeat protein